MHFFKQCKLLILLSQQIVISPKKYYNIFLVMTVSRAECLVKQLLLSGLSSREEDDEQAGRGGERSPVEQRGLRGQNNFDKSEIWGHIQGDVKRIKAELFVWGVSSLHPRDCNEHNRQQRDEFYLWTKRLTLDRMALLEVAAVIGALNGAPSQQQIFYSGRAWKINDLVNVGG